MEKILGVLEQFIKLFRANRLLIVTIAIGWWGTWGWLLYIDEVKAGKAKDIQLKVATDETIKALRQTNEVLLLQIVKNAK